MTLEELLESGLERYEHVNGELVPILPTSLEHSKISTNLISSLVLHVCENQLGAVYASDIRFWVGERMLVPYVVFLLKVLIPDNTSKACSIPLDLTVETGSPTDTLARIEEKVFAYLEGGT